MTPPVWMLRINPMARRRLADPALECLLEERARGERDTARLAQTATDDLHDVIPRIPEDLRGRVLALRRDIHNDRGQRPRCGS